MSAWCGKANWTALNPPTKRPSQTRARQNRISRAGEGSARSSATKNAAVSACRLATATTAPVSSAADLKFLHLLRQACLGTSNRKRHQNHKLAGAALLPKFVPESAAMYHELRKRGTSAADLKFLHLLRQACLGTSNRK